MKLGLIGCGAWGSVYAQELAKLGVDYWWAARDFGEVYAASRPDGVIIASSTDSHFGIAHQLITAGVPVLIEKPVASSARQAQQLLDASAGRIVFAGHTRLYDPGWPAFKEWVRANRHVGQRVDAYAGGVNAGNPDAELNWLAHFVPMCIDLGIQLEQVNFHITRERQPLRFVVDGMEFTDTRGGVRNLVLAFMRAIDEGCENVRALELGVQALRYVEARRESFAERMREWDRSMDDRR